jgi:hypothetical protein
LFEALTWRIHWTERSAGVYISGITDAPPVMRRVSGLNGSMKTSFMRIVLWSTALLLVVSCSDKKAIVGIWQYSDTSFMEFGDDGTYLTHGIGASKVTGHYSFVGGGKVKIQLSDGNSRVISLSIKGDQMTMIEGMATVKLQRVDRSAVEKSDEQWRAP